MQNIDFNTHAEMKLSSELFNYWEDQLTDIKVSLAPSKWKVCLPTLLKVPKAAAHDTIQLYDNIQNRGRRIGFSYYF